MKKGILLLIVFIVSVHTGLSQQANFQGKLYENGAPVNGIHDIRFFIGAPLNWSSASKLVSIQNGLYSVVIDFPSNLFDINTSSREMIVVIDGNKPIDTVTIFAPLERDPTVAGYIKDSISWGDVHNKPTVDTSFVNEIQSLSINGDTLAISGGNKIRLPLSHIPDLTAYGHFRVIDTAIHQSFSTLGNYTTCSGSTNQSYWQSFKATENGKLRQIAAPVAASCNNYVTVYIYNGQGTSTQYIGYKTCTVTSTLGLQNLDLSSGVSSSSSGSISLSVGQLYTFELRPPVGCSISVGCNNSDPYLDGVSSINSTTDIPFALYMDRSAPANLVVNMSGYVGIGVDSPTAQLEVKGRIKDQTGYVMPVGAILPFGGDVIPEGWMLCDGRAVSRSKYNDLYKVIKNIWGYGNNSTTFNLPDLRGQFLRGVDSSASQGTSNSDPDRATRIPSGPGGNTGVNVGSMQSDVFASHNHGAPYPFWLFQNPGGCCIGSGGNYLGSTNNTNNTGGNETRPKNAYVYFIIKY